MSQRTDIQWADSTINATSGCDGCELKIPGRKGSCYAVPIHENRLARSFPDKYAADFHEVRLIPGRMAQAAGWPDLAGKDRPDKPWLNGLPRVVFVGDMGDLFSKDVPFEFIRDEVFAAIGSPKGRRHLWMILTKQPKRLLEFSKWYTTPFRWPDLGDRGTWPENLICGTSVTTRATLSRLIPLLEVPGRLFVSAEPLWEAIDLAPYLDGLDLAIVGGQSGPGARPFDLAWARALRRQCDAAGTSYFLKQLGSNVQGYWLDPDGPGDAICHHSPDRGWRLKDSHGGDWSEWPVDLRKDGREFPRVPAPLEV